jgi:hypothetical protein
VQRYFAFDSAFRGGVNVALGNFPGYGPSLAATAGASGGPQAILFAYGSDRPELSFFVFDPSFRGGLVLAAGDWDGNGSDELAFGSATLGNRVCVLDPKSSTVFADFFAGPSGSIAGVRLAFEANELLVGNGPGNAVSVTGYRGSFTDMEQLPPMDPQRAYGIFVG